MLYYRLKIFALRTLNAGAITCQQHAQHFHKHLHLHSAFASNSIHSNISVWRNSIQGYNTSTRSSTSHIATAPCAKASKAYANIILTISIHHSNSTSYNCSNITINNSTQCNIIPCQFTSLYSTSIKLIETLFSPWTVFL